MRIKTRIPAYLALLPVCAGVFIAADDQTVIVTILPVLMLDMHVQINELDRASWAITGYLLGYVAVMPLMGRLSDAWGHRTLFLLSLALFMLGSVGVALSPDLSWVIGTRVVQAVGAGALVPVSIAIVGDLFPPERRGLPLGLIGGSAEAGGVIGPLWGGLIIRYLDWRWVFWINLPLSIAVLVGLLALLRANARYSARVDYLGGGLVALSIASLTLGLARVGRPDTLMAAYLSAAVIALVLFVLRQKSAVEPLLPIYIFRNATFSAANLAHLAVGGALIIGMVTVPLMANTVMGLQPLEGGLRLMRLTAAMSVGAIVGGMACQRLGYRLPTVAGLALAAAGFAFMSRWGIRVAEPGLTAHLAVAGLGFGLVIAPIALAATNSVDTGVRGTAAAVVTAMRIIGMTFGLAALTAWGVGRFQVLSAGIELPLPLPGETPEQAQQRLLEFQARLADVGLTLFHEFFLAAMAVCLAAIVPALLMTWRRARERRPPEVPSGDR